MTWRIMKEAPRDGTQILAARFNDCFWEYAVVWWTCPCTYPWASNEGSAYTVDRFDLWTPIKEPRA